jgi:hypothetical protein
VEAEKGHNEIKWLIKSLETSIEASFLGWIQGVLERSAAAGSERPPWPLLSGLHWKPSLVQVAKKQE